MHYGNNDNGSEAINRLTHVVNMATNKLNPSYWVGEKCLVSGHLLVKVLAMDSSGITFEALESTEDFSENGIYFSPWPKLDDVCPFLKLA